MKILTILTFFLLLYACAPKEAIQPEKPLPIPENITPEVLAERIDFSYVRTLRAALRVRIQQRNNAKGTFSGALLYSHPDRLNIRLFGPFRLTVMEILFNRGLLQVFIPSRDILYSGTVAFKRLLPGHDTLEGSVKFMKESDDVYLLYILDQEDEETRDKLPGRRVMAVYSFNKTDLSWNALELYADGKRQVRMEIFKTENRLPTEMVIYINDTSFYLQLKDITLNRDMGEDYFLPLDASERYPLSLFLRNLEP